MYILKNALNYNKYLWNNVYKINFYCYSLTLSVIVTYIYKKCTVYIL